MGPFRIGINMAGAISAGAYTAGVLDFMIQALDQWHEAKARGDLVPLHDVSIEVMAGASAGGMCAAIGSVALQEQFPPVTAVDPPGDQSANKLYSSWVERIDISSLLKTEDLKDDAPVVSLLDSTVLPQIAQFALTPGARRARKYISPNLTLFLTLTNLRGTVYNIDPANNGTFEEQIAYYADVLQFETVQKAGDNPKNILAKPLPLAPANADAEWQLLQDTALATGAFPLMLAPRILTRDLTDYTKKLWDFPNPDPKCVPQNPADPASPKVCDCEIQTTVPPNFGQGGSIPAQIKTVNVDGGATNNNPFEMARRFLASIDPKPSSGHNERDPLRADRAVVTIAPFPGQASFNPAYDVNESRKLFKVIGALVDALISQSRFLGQSISLLKDNDSFSRFVIAPSDDKAGPGQPALMSSCLGAFGGFVSKKFRQRDFQLGRRNCQRFLQQHFVLDAANPIIKSGLSADPASLIRNFKSADGLASNRPAGAVYIPIIPLCGTAAVPIDHPGRPTVPESTVKDLSGRAADRVSAVVKSVVAQSSGLVRVGIAFAVFLFKGKIKDAIQEYLTNGLGPTVEKGK